MALTATRTLQRVETYPDNRVMVIYEVTVDDPNDNLLPLTSSQLVTLEPLTPSTDDEGNAINIPTDVSNHDPLVQTICNAVWNG